MNQQTVGWLVVGVVVGLGLGFGGATLLEGEEAGPGELTPSRIDAPAARGGTTQVEVPVLQAAEERGLSADESSAREGPLVGPRLLAYAEDAYRATRDELGEPVTPDELEAMLERFPPAVLSLPADFARSDVREIQTNRARDARLAQVESELAAPLFLALMREGGEVPEFEMDDPFVDGLVTNRTRTGSQDGASFAEGDELVAEGLVLSFGSGIHALDEKRLRGPRGEPFPTDITLEGTGMDSTLLRLNDVSIRGDVERLTLRDMTIDCMNDGLFDLRSGTLSVDVVRVRFVRFDAAHGGCDLFSANYGMVLDMRDSEVIGGFGRAPGRGELLDGSPIVGRFTNVLFDLLDPSFDKLDRALFTACRFERIHESYIEQGNLLDFQNCDFGEILPGSYSDAEYRRSLNELFPGSVDS